MAFVWFRYKEAICHHKLLMAVHMPASSQSCTGVVHVRNTKDLPPPSRFLANVYQSKMVWICKKFMKLLTWRNFPYITWWCKSDHSPPMAFPTTKSKSWLEVVEKTHVACICLLLTHLILPLCLYDTLIPVPWMLWHTPGSESLDLLFHQQTFGLSS